MRYSEIVRLVQSLFKLNKLSADQYVKRFIERNKKRLIKKDNLYSVKDYKDEEIEDLKAKLEEQNRIKLVIQNGRPLFTTMTDKELALSREFEKKYKTKLIGEDMDKILVMNEETGEPIEFDLFA